MQVHVLSVYRYNIKEAEINPYEKLVESRPLKELSNFLEHVDLREHAYDINEK